jgi:hypothetical protein
MKYSLICDVADISEISQGASGEIICQGSLSVVEYSPTLSDLSMSEVEGLLAAVLLLFSISFVFRFVYNQILNK